MEPEKCEKIEWFDIDNVPENLAWYTKNSIEDYKNMIMK